MKSESQTEIDRGTKRKQTEIDMGTKREIGMGSKRKQTEIGSSSSSSSNENDEPIMEKRNCVPEPSQSVSDVFRRPDKEFVELRKSIADELKRLYDLNMITDLHQLINAGRAWHYALLDSRMNANFILVADDKKKVAFTMHFISKHKHKFS